MQDLKSRMLNLPEALRDELQVIPKTNNESQRLQDQM